MKKYVWIVALIAALAMVFTGCDTGTTGKTAYTVIFDPNKPGDAPASAVVDGMPQAYTKVAGNSKIDRPAQVPTLAGYDFVNWYKDKDGIDGAGEWDFAADLVAGDTTIYAGWKVEDMKLPADAPANAILLGPPNSAGGSGASYPHESQRGWATIGNSVMAGYTATLTIEELLTAEYLVLEMNNPPSSLKLIWGGVGEGIVSDNPGWNDSGTISLNNPPTGVTKEDNKFTFRLADVLANYENGFLNALDSARILIDISGSGAIAALQITTAYLIPGDTSALVPVTVSFDTDGGVPAAIDDVEVTAGFALSSHYPADPTKEGYRFKGWFDTGDHQYTASTAVSATVTLKAKWAQLFTVSFDANGGLPAAIAPVQVEAGQTMADAEEGRTPPRNVYPADPTLGTGVFVGWYTDTEDSDTLVDKDTVISGDIDLIAAWQTGTPVTITFDSDGGSAVANVVILEGTAMGDDFPAPPVKTLQTFEGWFDAATMLIKYDKTTVIDADTALKAKWTQLLYTIQINPPLQIDWSDTKSWNFFANATTLHSGDGAAVNNLTYFQSSKYIILAVNGANVNPANESGTQLGGMQFAAQGGGNSNWAFTEVETANLDLWAGYNSEDIYVVIDLNKLPNFGSLTGEGRFIFNYGVDAQLGTGFIGYITNNALAADATGGLELKNSGGKAGSAGETLGFITRARPDILGVAEFVPVTAVTVTSPQDGMVGMPYTLSRLVTPNTATIQTTAWSIESQTPAGIASLDNGTGPGMTFTGAGTVVVKASIAGGGTEASPTTVSSDNFTITVAPAPAYPGQAPEIPVLFTCYGGWAEALGDVEFDLSDGVSVIFENGVSALGYTGLAFRLAGSPSGGWFGGQVEEGETQDQTWSNTAHATEAHVYVLAITSINNLEKFVFKDADFSEVLSISLVTAATLPPAIPKLPVLWSHVMGWAAELGDVEVTFESGSNGGNNAIVFDPAIDISGYQAVAITFIDGEYYAGGQVQDSDGVQIQSWSGGGLSGNVLTLLFFEDDGDGGTTGIADLAELTFNRGYNGMANVVSIELVEDD